MRLLCNNILYNVMLFTNYVCIYFTLLQNKYHYHYHRLRLLNMLVNIMRNCFDSYHANRILVWDGHLEGKFCWQTNINIGIFNNKTIFMLCRNVYTV